VFRVSADHGDECEAEQHEDEKDFATLNGVSQCQMNMGRTILPGQPKLAFSVPFYCKEVDDSSKVSGSSS
jgi:hypothetical protein